MNGGSVGFMHLSFPLFRVFGIVVRMHWIMAILVVAWLLRGATQMPSYSFGIALGFTAITIAILLLTILIHELCHCWMAVRLGGEAEQILLWPLGGLASVQFHPTPMNHIKVAGVGPLSNFVLGGICLGALMATGAEWRWDYLNPMYGWFVFGHSLTQMFILHAVKLNILLGLFNLVVPAYPLDGGKILMMALTIRMGKLRAAEVTSIIGIPVGVAMMIFGFVQDQPNWILIIIGGWVIFEAWQLRKLIRMGDLDAHPAFHGVGDYEYLPDPMIQIRAASRQKKPGFFARWRAKRARARLEREERESHDMAVRVDAVLEKVSREGIGSLTPDERQLLDRASRRNRGED